MTCRKKLRSHRNLLKWFKIFITLFLCQYTYVVRFVHELVLMKQSMNIVSTLLKKRLLMKILSENVREIWISSTKCYAHAFNPKHFSIAKTILFFFNFFKFNFLKTQININSLPFGHTYNIFWQPVNCSSFYSTLSIFLELNEISDFSNADILPFFHGFSGVFWLRTFFPFNRIKKFFK